MRNFKKFSGISKHEVASEPIRVENKKEDSLKYLKFQLLDLMNDNLRIVSLGGARKNILPHVKIDGKELFVDALIDFLSTKEFKDKISALESLKSESYDWASIDRKVISIKESLDKKELKVKLKNTIQKIEKIVKIYENEDFALNMNSTLLNQEELLKRLQALDFMIGSDDWNNIKDHLVKLKNNYTERLEK